MSSLNKVMLIGYCGQDPKIAYLPDGTGRSTVSIATTERFTDKSTGELREQTEWHYLVFWRKLAELVSEYAYKGSKIYVEGKIKTHEWTDENNMLRKDKQIIVSALKFLDKKTDHPEPSSPASNPCTPSTYAKQTGRSTLPVDELDDDIPF